MRPVRAVAAEIRSTPRVVLAVFAAGIAVRIALVLLYRPAFLGISDSGSYLYAAHYGLFDNVFDPAGYPLFIRVVHGLYPHLSALIVLQHVLGVLNAWLLYVIVRRITGSQLLGLLPAVIVLFDGYLLWVEHTPLTETLFAFLVTCVLAVALLGPPGVRSAAIAGVIIGSAALVRPVGLVLALILGAWFAARPSGARARLAGLGALLLPVICIVGAYLIVQHADTGFTGLTQDSGRVLYARAAGFADCRKFTPPTGTRALCETTPPSRRGSFNQYLTGFPDHASPSAPVDRTISPAWRVFGPPPAGNSRLQAFGLAAIVHQPLDYAGAVARDFHYYWTDDHRAFIAAAARPDPGIDRIVSGYFHTAFGVAASGLGVLRWYGDNIQVSGLLMLLLFLLPIPALAFARGEQRWAACLLTAVGWLLPLAADAAASVDPRFVVPAYGPLAAAGAVAVSCLRSGALAGRLRPARRLPQPSGRL